MTEKTVERKSGGEKPAIAGGTPVRKKKMPPRRQFGEAELAAVREVFAYYAEQQRDFGYQDEFEARYTAEFVRYQGVPGYADAVCTGSAALFVAFGALRLPAGSEILVPAMSGDPGPISAAILNQFRLRIVDTLPDSYNMDDSCLASRVTAQTRAVLIVHPAGFPVAIERIQQFCQERGLLLIEDCSQAHGAMRAGMKVGNFGHIAAFSTMYRKNHGSGGCGGMVFTQDEALYRMARAVADRGKPFWREDFDPKNPTQFVLPALNFNQDELSCAIGLSTIQRLEEVNERRRKFVRDLSQALADHSSCCRAYPQGEHDSPFFLPVSVEISRLRCSKIEFAKAVAAEGIDLNPHYNNIVTEWPWAKSHLVDDFHAENAVAFRNRSFNILFNENYGTDEVTDIVQSITRVEQYFA